MERFERFLRDILFDFSAEVLFGYGFVKEPYVWFWLAVVGAIFAWGGFSDGLYVIGAWGSAFTVLMIALWQYRRS